MNVMPTIPQLAQKHDIAFSLHVRGQEHGKLLVTAFEAEERLNGLTRADVALTSADAGIDLTALIDRPATLTVHSKYDAAPRHFSGVVAAVSRGDTGHHRTAYRLTILPPVSRLAHVSDSRIFQDLSVPEIVRTLLAEHGIDQVRWDLGSRGHDSREYCVMYRETLLAFIERICAEEGIWTHHVHEADGRATIVFVDDMAATPWCEHQKELEYNAMASGAVKGVWCSHLSWREQLRSTSYSQRDYTFRNPPHTLEHRHRAGARNGVADAYPLYDGNGRYKHDDQGRPFTRYKLEATRVDASCGEGIANAPHLSAGHRFALTDHPNLELNRTCLVLSVRHCGRQPQALGADAAAGSGGSDPFDPFGLAPPLRPAGQLAGQLTGMNGAGSGARAAALGSLPGVAAHPAGGPAIPLPAAGEGTADATLYANSFTIMPASLPYRPPHLAKPLVDGPQMAHVVGPPGEEIFTDEHGRVKVQFPWDRYGEANDRSSCWIRVAQNWGGAMWGHIAIPRIGHEVIVDFLEGDPDQPIVTGRTYHANNRPPYKLPEHKTKMSIKSKTHKGNGYNELRFEDEKGREEIYIHGEKDRNEKINNNHTERIDNNWVQTVGHNKAVEVANNHEEVIGGNMTLSIGPSHTAKIMNKALSSVSEGISSIGYSFGMPGAANLGEGNFSLFVEKNQLHTIGVSYAESVGVYKTTYVGDSYKMDVGKEMTIKIGDELSIGVGKSRLIMKKDGTIQIIGANILIQGSEKIEVLSEIVKIN